MGLASEGQRNVATWVREAVAFSRFVFWNGGMNGDIARHAGRLRGQVEVDAVEQVSLLDVHQELTVRGPASVGSRPGDSEGVARALAKGQDLEGAEVVVAGEADLLEVVGALSSPGRLSSRLHGGQKKSDQNGDDGDDDKQARSA